MRKENWPIDIVVGWHEFKLRKPHPLCLQVAMQHAGARPEECFHIGDLPIDTEASRNAGVRSIGAGWSTIDAVALRRSRPDHYFELVRQLHDFILTL